jgi:hypothetical protein
LYRKDINFTFLFILANFNFLRPIPVVLLIDEMHLYSEIEPDKIIGSLVLFRKKEQDIAETDRAAEKTTNCQFEQNIRGR